MSVPTRSRAAAAPAASAVAPGFLSGAAARERSQALAAEQSQNSARRSTGADMDAFNRSRFFLKSGEEADLIILDHTLDECLFADEHAWQVDTGQKWQDGNPRKEMRFEFCPKQHDNCPLCDKPGVNASSYTFYLTVIDLRGHQPRDGEFIPHVKRGLAVRSNLHGEFFKLHDIAMREHGTMRGMQILMARDTGQMSNSTGKPVMGNDGTMFSMIPEEALMHEFGHAAVFGDDGVQVKAENYDVTPFAYRSMFTQPSGADLRRRYGISGGAAPAENEQQWSGNQPPAAPQGGLPPRSRSRSSVAPGAPPAAMPATARPRTAAAAPAPVTPLYAGADEDRAAIEGDGTTVADENPPAPQETRSTPVPTAQMPPRTRTAPVATAAPAAAPVAARARSAPAAAPAVARPRTVPTAAAAAPAPAPQVAPQAIGRVVRRAANSTATTALDSDIPF